VTIVSVMTKTARVLIVEDEPTLADAMRYGLEREGFRCSVSTDGNDALARFKSDPPDLVLLDLMLPGTPGEEVCKAIRKAGSTPIIIVSAKTSELDRVLGLELGADDYITKPFSSREVLARVRSVLRRSGDASQASIPSVLVGGPIELDVDKHEARVHGVTISLPPKEFMLLEALMRRAGKLCTRDSLIGDVWGANYYGDTRTLDVHIKRLRTKVEEDPRRPRYLLTVRGLGYKFEP
jgi:two-component system response regulator RegX3